MLLRIYEIRQVSPVLDRHWTNILIVGFLQVTTTVQSRPVDNVRRTSVTSSRGLYSFEAGAMHRLMACVAAHVLNSEHQMLEHRTEDQCWRAAQCRHYN